MITSRAAALIASASSSSLSGLLRPLLRVEDSCSGCFCSSAPPNIPRVFHSLILSCTDDMMNENLKQEGQLSIPEDRQKDDATKLSPTAKWIKTQNLCFLNFFFHSRLLLTCDSQSYCLRPIASTSKGGVEAIEFGYCCTVGQFDDIVHSFDSSKLLVVVDIRMCFFLYLVRVSKAPKWMIETPTYLVQSL